MENRTFNGKVCKEIMYHTKGEELGALNRRFRLQDLTLPEARQNDGPGLFVKTTVARSTQRPPCADTLISNPGPSRESEDCRLGVRLFLSVYGRHAFMNQPRGAYINEGTYK